MTASGADGGGAEPASDPDPDPWEAVTAHPDGDATVARLAATAADAGYAGVVVRNWPAVAADVDDPAAYRERVVAEYGVDVATGVTVTAADPAGASGRVGQVRPDYEVVAVRGGTPALNRFAVESSQVDILAAPMRGEGDVNHVLARSAADNGVLVEFGFDRLLRTAGGGRVRVVSRLRKLREILAHYGTPHVVSARADSHLALRAPRELGAVGAQAGFEAEAVREGLAAWGERVARNRERRSETFIGPGVELEDDEADS